MGICVHVRLVGALDVQSEVFGLDGCKLGELGVDVLEVESSDLLIKDLGDEVDANGLLAGFTELHIFLAESGVVGLEKEDLSEDLVGERAGHDE